MKNKKTVLSLVLAIVLALMPLNVYAETLSPLQAIYVNKQYVPFSGQNPVVVNGVTLVPLSDVFEALGFTITWNDSTRQATLTRGKNTIVITIGSDTFTLNGVKHKLAAPAQTTNGKVMVSIREILESVGYSIEKEKESWYMAILTPAPRFGGASDKATPDPMVYYDYAYFANIPDLGAFVKNPGVSNPTEPSTGMGYLRIQYSIPNFSKADTKTLYDSYVAALLADGFELTKGTVKYSIDYYVKNHPVGGDGGMGSNVAMAQFVKGDVSVTIEHVPGAYSLEGKTWFVISAVNKVHQRV